MIERLLAADRALDGGDLETASRLFDQVADADPRNGIAVVGQARVARRRGAADEARRLAAAALAIDPDEVAAQRLLDELEPSGEPASEPAAAQVPNARRGGLIGWLGRLFGR